MKRLLLFIAIIIFILGCKQSINDSQPIRLLIISGSNNHEWQETTPFLERIFIQAGIFEVNLTNRPDTLAFPVFQNYDAIVSNWNSWPENDIRWPDEVESGLLRFLEEGGGLVFFHSSTSAFYEWPEFKSISTGAWVDDTWHGKNSPVEVKIENHEHPITQGLSNFYIFDELWTDAEQNNKFKILGSAINKETLEKGYEKQSAILVSEYGKGRIFHTLLGHDVRALRNTGFQTLLLRGTEWAATSKVSIPIPFELKQSSPGKEYKYSWVENDSVYTLFRNNEILWQFNFNTKFGKPFFHPIYVNKNRITCLSPDDHIWHLGQWFSWKFINGKNYWEYIGKSYNSEGVTDIKEVKLLKNSDYSAEISLWIEYHPADEVTILKEHRTIRISPPQDDGSIRMDYELNFEAIADEVDLNRTPILGEPDGQSWGGYSGLSIRFNQDFMNPEFVSSFGENKDVNGKAGDWLYMGFQGLDGKRIGSAIMISNDTRRRGETWYSVIDPAQPFYYFSPAYLYLAPKLLRQGEKIKLKYRILHFEGKASYDNLSNEFNKYIDHEKNQPNKF